MGRLLTFTIAVLVVGCADNFTGEGKFNEPAPAADESQIRSTSRLPDKATNPDGGVDDRRIRPLKPEEQVERVGGNISQPIVFGEGAANIKMTTTLDESRSILSSPLGISDGMYFYSENIRVIWSENDDGITVPEFIFVDIGYRGALKLPKKYGTVQLGTAMKKYFPDTDEFGEELILELGRYFEGKDDDDYHCLDLRTCGIQVTGTHIRFIFRSGDLFFLRNDDLPLDVVSLVPPPPADSDPLTDEVIVGTGAGGVKLTEDREQILSKLGEPVSVDFLGIHIFDNGNFEVFFDNTTDEVLSMTLRIGYAGLIDLPSSLGEIRIGDPLSDHFDNDDPLGEDLLKAMGKYFDGKEADDGYDCTLVNSCAVQIGNNVLYFRFDAADFVISPGDGHRIDVITLYQQGPPRTTPLTLAINFPDDLGGVDFTNTEAQVEAALGASRGQFTNNSQTFYRYDNDNVYITYDDEATPTTEVIQINPKYQGDLTMPAPWGTVNLGDSFEDEFPGEDPTGEDFIKELTEFYRGEADGYDCLAESTCAIQTDLSFVYFIFEQGRFIFDNLEKKLQYVIFDENQEFPEE